MVLASARQVLPESIVHEDLARMTAPDMETASGLAVSASWDGQELIVR